MSSSGVKGSPSLIRKRTYALLRSNLLRIQASHSCSRVEGTNGSGSLYLTVTELRKGSSMQSMRLPSLFCTEKNPASTGDVEKHMKSEAHASLND